MYGALVSTGDTEAKTVRRDGQRHGSLIGKADPIKGSDLGSNPDRGFNYKERA